MSDRGAPTFYVEVFPATSKKAAAVDVSLRVLSFTFDDDEKQANKVELELDNFDLSLFDDPLWRKGNLLEVAWGYAGNLAPAREAVIQKITGFTVLKVEALARSILMNKFPRSRLFEHKKRSEIVAIIADENGFPESLQDIEDTEVVFESVSQARMSDAQFCRHLAQREGFEFYVDFDGFHWHRRRVGTRPTKVFVYYTDPNAGEIISINIESDATATPGAVTAKGRDPIEKKTISARADNAGTKRDALQPVVEVVDRQTGETAFLSGAAAEATILSNAPSASAAEREAKGKFIQAQQTTVMLSMSCIGDPRVSAKQVVEILNISKRLSGRYYVKHAKHKVSGTDYTMDLHCRSDGTRGIGAAGKLNPKNDGAQNTKDPADLNALTPSEAVDRVTGETKIVFSKKGAQK